MQQQIEEALESSDLTNLKASVTHVFQFKAEVKTTSTYTSKMILKLSIMSILNSITSQYAWLKSITVLLSM